VLRRATNWKEKPRRQTKTGEWPWSPIVKKEAGIAQVINDLSNPLVFMRSLVLYPPGGEYANDTGQKNLPVEQSLRAGAASEDAHTGQQLVDPNNARLLKPEGAGRLPTVQGPQIKIEPPVSEATRMPKQ